MGATRGGKDSPRTLQAVGLFLAAAAAVGAALLASAYLLLRPDIARASPVAVSPQDIVTLEGRGFGEGQRAGSVLIGSRPIPESAYIERHDSRIMFKLQDGGDTELVKVRTIWGLSDPVILVAEAQMPQIPQIGSALPSGPSISSVSPPEASSGNLLIIEGINFGTDPQDGKVLFPSTITRAVSVSESEESAESASPLPLEAATVYEEWNDKRILVRVPEGAGSGSIVVSTRQGDSPPFPFVANAVSGAKYLYDPAVYSLTFSVMVEKTRYDPDGVLVLHMPDPVESWSQRTGGEQRSSGGTFLGDFGSTTAYVLDDARLGRSLFSRSMVVTVYSVDTDLEQYSESFKEKTMPPFLAAWMESDESAPWTSKEIKALAAKIVGRERNLQKKALLVSEWMKSHLRWNGKADRQKSASSIISAGAAGTKPTVALAVALLRASGLPAAPVSGFLIGEGRAGIAHMWLQYYLPNIGWIPYDPVLASGAIPEGFEGGLDQPSHYFGALDNRHLAMSEGTVDVMPLVGGDEPKPGDTPFWSLQTVFEESRGIEYRSEWMPVEVLGQY